MDKSSEKIAFGTAPPKRCFEAIYKIIEFRSGTGIFGSIQSHGNQAPSATAARAGAARGGGNRIRNPEIAGNDILRNIRLLGCISYHIITEKYSQ